MDRPDYDEYFMEFARTAAKRATCDRGRSGAVIVRDKQVVSTGYVGAAKGLPHCDEVGHLIRSVTYEDGSIHQHCVSGDTIILKFQKKGYNSRHRTIKYIAERWKTPKDVRWMKKMKIRCVSKTGMIVPGYILDAWEVGLKKLFEVTTFLGRSVKTSIDHRFLTPDGWTSLNKLDVGDSIALNGVALVEDPTWLKKKYEVEGLTQITIAQLAGCDRGTVRRRLEEFSIPIRPFKFGGWNKGIVGEQNHSYKGRSVVHDSSARERSRKKALSSCCLTCGSKKSLQVHHLDRDVRNDEYHNLVTLCFPCHNLAHSSWAVREKVVMDRIVSIKSIGEEPLYDMETSHSNFVGDGVVLHNCCRTAHAESNAIVQAAKHGISVNGSTLYCKMEPCLSCCVDIINAGIVRVVAEYKYHGAALTREWFKKAGVELVVLNQEDASYE